MTNSYYGGQERKLDYKGRMSIPEELLSQDGAPLSRAVLVRANSDAPGGPYPYISLYDTAEWRDLLQSAPRELDEDELRLFMHKRVGDAATVDVDTTKRITIPERLLRHANIEKQGTVWVMGGFYRVEMWNPSTYAANIEALEAEELPVPSLIDLARKRLREVS